MTREQVDGGMLEKYLRIHRTTEPLLCVENYLHCFMGIEPVGIEALVRIDRAGRDAEGPRRRPEGPA